MSMDKFDRIFDLHGAQRLPASAALARARPVRRAPCPARNAHRQIADASTVEPSGVEQRIRILGAAARPAGEAFRAVAGATLQRQRVRIADHSRGRDQRTERSVSPQRLVHYRDNWYLDAKDHLRDDLRSFSVDRILRVVPLNEAAEEVPGADLDAFFASAYGIALLDFLETEICQRRCIGSLPRKLEEAMLPNVDRNEVFDDRIDGDVVLLKAASPVALSREV
jgi:predicted DNA-binding transcriptional regulator YafY